MNVTVKYPSRSRPDLFRARLTEYLRDPIARVLVSADLDDLSMHNAEMIGWLESLDRVTTRFGNCHSKVEAVNDGLDVEPWDGICVVGGDDMVPQRADFGQRIRDLFDERFPEGDGVLHLNDGRVGKALNTLPILDRKYWERDRYCYCPQYVSVWVDNEFQEVSERRGRAAYVSECIIRHEWIGETAPDQLHLRNESFSDRDGRLFEARRQAGFPQ